MEQGKGLAVGLGGGQRRGSLHNRFGLRWGRNGRGEGAARGLQRIKAGSMRSEGQAAQHHGQEAKACVAVWGGGTTMSGVVDFGASLVGSEGKLASSRNKRVELSVCPPVARPVATKNHDSSSVRSGSDKNAPLVPRRAIAAKRDEGFQSQKEEKGKGVGRSRRRGK